MTPQKIKADELFDKYYSLIPPRMGRYDLAKECALIAVDQMMSLGILVKGNFSDAFYSYWKDVKQEIEKL